MKSILQKCKKCGEIKTFSEFYPHKGCKDEVEKTCKKCRCLMSKTWRQANRYRWKGYQEKFYSTEHGRKQRLLSAEEWHKKEPLKYRARWSLNNAVRYGKIEKPNICPKCGSNQKRIEGHHPNPTEPLEVVWMCSRCHRMEHGMIVL